MTRAEIAGEQAGHKIPITEGPVRILVADDDPILREFASMELSDQVVAVENAADGLDAWQLLTQGKFDLLLVDLDMPRLNGFELIQRIRDDPVLATLPIVVITGREDMAAIDRAYEVGATSFATKPINWRLLRYQLRYVLRMGRVEAQIREARDRAEAASALRGNILKLMRHEVHTPMNAILGFSRLLGADAPAVPTPNEAREYAGHIAEAGDRLCGTLSDILQFAEMLSGDVDLYEDDYLPAQIIEGARLLVSTALDRPGLALEVSNGVVDARLACDRSKVERALANLLDNAARFGPQDVHIRLEAKCDDSGAIVFCVVDNGPGIPADIIPSCFEPFQQGDGLLARAREGLGLGLPIARRIAELHGADLSLQSSPGNGTSVALRFPPERTVVD